MKRLLVTFVLAAAAAVANGAGLTTYTGGGGNGGYVPGLNQPVRPNMGPPVYGSNPMKPPPRPVSPKRTSNVQKFNQQFKRDPNYGKAPAANIQRQTPGGPDPKHHGIGPSRKGNAKPSASLQRETPGGPDPKHHRRLFGFWGNKRG